MKILSKYTTEVRYICETAANLTESKGYSYIDEILTAAAPKIFDFEFPIYDENYRSILEKKILKHYYIYNDKQLTKSFPESVEEHQS